ncbi:MAG: hypothetical protein IIA45_16000, partial [Bacteroidetes bacterium]|nr:hypothetical protein [Bacteroidota bacterium]
MRYRFELFMAKGGIRIFISLLVVFLVLFLVIVFIKWILLLLNPGLDNVDFATHIWRTWLQMTDPGNMYQDNDTKRFFKISTILAGVAGVVILSMLIAIITTALEKTLYEFRKGRGRVLETGHSLILGWNERVVDILRELVIANESEKHASVVILAPEDKEMMDDMIIKRLPDTKTTRIITSSGDPSNINE